MSNLHRALMYPPLHLGTHALRGDTLRPVGSEEAAADVFGGERSGGPSGGTDGDGLIDPCSSRVEVPLPCGVGVLPVIIRAG
jgi:hypothetical protein